MVTKVLKNDDMRAFTTVETKKKQFYLIFFVMCADRVHMW